MSRAPRYLELSDKAPSRKFPGWTVQQCIDDPEGIKWITWLVSNEGFAALNCKLNGGECKDYYHEKLNQTA